MKKKYLTRVLGVVCAVAVAFSTVACGSTKNQKVDNSVEDTKNLEIMIYPMGYGTEWLEAIIKAFEAEHEGVDVKLNIVNSEELIATNLKNTDYCSTDLYFDVYSLGQQVLISEFQTSWDGKQALRDLTEVYNSKVPGEDITVAEKMNDSLLANSRYAGRDTEDTSDDQYYTIPYLAGGMGLCYNETVIDNALGKGKWSVPNTTDELIALCDRLKAEGCYLLTPANVNYFGTSLYLSWWAQYEGMENFMKFYDGIGYNPTKNREEQNSSYIFEQPGRQEALEVSHKLLNYENGYALKNCIEINVNNLNEYQTRFMVSSNKYALYPCGDWLMQEVKAKGAVQSDSVIKVMRTPVISSIIESTDSYSDSDEKRLPNITSDAILSKVINYIDGNGELPAGVTEEEVEIIREARSIAGSKGFAHMAFAPAFSNAKALANEFLLFMATDKAIQIFKDNCQGSFSCYDYEYSDLDATTESFYNLTKDAIFVEDFRHHPLFYKGGVQGVTAGTGIIDIQLCSPEGMTPQEMYEETKKVYSGKKWEAVLDRFQ